MPVVSQRIEQEADSLYEQHVRPLEGDHLGEYVAISPEGKTVLGPTPLDVLQQATAAFGMGNFIFKIGERVVGKWR